MASAKEEGGDDEDKLGTGPEIAERLSQIRNGRSDFGSSPQFILATMPLAPLISLLLMAIRLCLE